MTQGKPTTPRKISGSIRRFVQALGTNITPQFLPFTFVSEKYLPRYCLNNCEAEQKANGNRIVFGWVIWENRKQVFVEAEFHAVITQGNTLVDITPRVDGEETILFAPDPARVAERIDARTWRLWTNQKSLLGQIVERTMPIEIEDVAGNVIA
jgi:hypothetical protein